MSKKKGKHARDKKRFSKTAQRTRKINVSPKYMRGGIRL